MLPIIGSLVIIGITVFMIFAMNKNKGGSLGER